MPRIVARQPAPPQGAVSRANSHRPRGRTDTRYACRNPITDEKPDFHRAEFFGELTFE